MASRSYVNDRLKGLVFEELQQSVARGVFALSVGINRYQRYQSVPVGVSRHKSPDQIMLK
jgi:hypothetical protein